MRSQQFHLLLVEDDDLDVMNVHRALGQAAEIASITVCRDGVEALKLLRQNGLERRVERRLCDVAVDGGFVRPADVVVLHRVVCCYPDYARLLTAVAQHSTRLVVFSHPPRNPISRFAVAAANLRLRLQRKDFRVFVHPPAALLAVLEQDGLRPTFAHRGLVWHIQGLAR